MKRPHSPSALENSHEGPGIPVRGLDFIGIFSRIRILVGIVYIPVLLSFNVSSMWIVRYGQPGSGDQNLVLKTPIMLFFVSIVKRYGCFPRWLSATPLREWITRTWTLDVERIIRDREGRLFPSPTRGFAEYVMDCQSEGNSRCAPGLFFNCREYH